MAGRVVPVALHPTSPRPDQRLGGQNRAALGDTKGVELQALSSHATAIVGVAFSPDGKSIVSAGEQNSASGRPPPCVFAGHQGPVFGVAACPMAQVVTASADKTPTSSRSLRANPVRTLTAMRDAVKAVAVTKDVEDRLRFRRQDGDLNAADGKPLLTYPAQASRRCSRWPPRSDNKTWSSAWPSWSRKGVRPGRRPTRRRPSGSTSPDTPAPSWRWRSWPIVPRWSTGSDDRTVKLWPLPRPGARSTGHQCCKSTAAWSPDGVGGQATGRCRQQVARTWEVIRN